MLWKWLVSTVKCDLTGDFAVLVMFNTGFHCTSLYSMKGTHDSFACDVSGGMVFSQHTGWQNPLDWKGLAESLSLTSPCLGRISWTRLSRTRSSWVWVAPYWAAFSSIWPPTVLILSCQTSRAVLHTLFWSNLCAIFLIFTTSLLQNVTVRNNHQSWQRSRHCLLLVCSVGFNSSWSHGYLSTFYPKKSSPFVQLGTGSLLSIFSPKKQHLWFC